MSLVVALAWASPSSRADVLVGVNGEKFIGHIISESTASVEFQSEFAGRMTVPRERIRTLERTRSPVPNAILPGALASTNAFPAAALSKIPFDVSGLRTSRWDWVQLKSGEWLKGELRYIQQKKVEFDSDELEGQTFKLKNIAQIYTAHPVFAKFENMEPTFGWVVISNQVIQVDGLAPVTATREQLTGITPEGQRGDRYWSGKFSTGLNLQSGNTKQITFNTSAEISRRTPNTWAVLDYLGNYSTVNGIESADNHRVNAGYNIRLNRNWFVSPLQAEYYRDPLANIGLRLTGGVGVGYYILDRDELEWRVGLGPGYQFTEFDTVEPGQARNASTAALMLHSRFRAELTKRLDLTLSVQSTLMDAEAGLYTHHAVAGLEFEIKHHLNLDISFVWDYLEKPTAESSRNVPAQSDFYLILGLGAKF
jgi:hypothetical protein